MRSNAWPLGLAGVRERGGRLFILGAGGGAGHASHAVNDFRKICDLECYCPSDNVSELTARVNDEGWDVAYCNWLRGSRLSPLDGILVFSVGGGSREHGSQHEPRQRARARPRRSAPAIFGVVGRAGRPCSRASPTSASSSRAVPPERLTPHTEDFQAVVWHLLVSHPALARTPGDMGEHRARRPGAGR